MDAVTDQIIAVTVVGDDRPGIVADVTSALAGLRGNLEDSTMTLLRGHFAMVVLVRTAADPSVVEQALTPVTADGGLVVTARRLSEPTPTSGSEADHVLHVHGADRPGIVAAITRVVADHDVNIVDLGTRLGDGLYVLVAQLCVPDGTDTGRLRQELQAVAGDLGVEVRLSPVDDDVL